MTRAIAAVLLLIGLGASSVLADEADTTEEAALAEIEACTLEDVGYNKPETLWDCHSAAFSACMDEADTSFHRMSGCYVLETRRIDTLIDRQLTSLKLERRKKVRDSDSDAQFDTFCTLLDTDQAAWEAYRQSEAALVRLSFGYLEGNASTMVLTQKRYLRLRMMGFYYRLPEGLP